MKNFQLKKAAESFKRTKKICHNITTNVYIYFNFGEISLQTVIIWEYSFSKWVRSKIRPVEVKVQKLEKERDGGTHDFSLMRWGEANTNRGLLFYGGRGEGGYLWAHYRKHALSKPIIQNRKNKKKNNGKTAPSELSISLARRTDSTSRSVFMPVCIYARLFAQNETTNDGTAENTMNSIISNFYSSKVPKKNKKNRGDMGQT